MSQSPTSAPSPDRSNPLSRPDLLEQAKDQALARMAAELRSPRDGLLAVMDRLIAESPAPTLERARLLSQYRETRVRLLALCADVERLTGARTSPADAPQTSALEVIRLSDLLQWSMTRARDDRALDVHLHAAANEIRCVKGDPVLLPHALVLLLDLAHQHASHNQAVSVTALDLAGQPAIRIEALGRGLGDPSDGQTRDLGSLPHAADSPCDSTHDAALAGRILAFYHCHTSAENLVPPGVRFTVRFHATAAT